MRATKLKTLVFQPSYLARPSYLVHPSYLALLFLSIFLGGCGLGLSPPEKNPQVLFIALDGTGSYDHLEQIKKLDPGADGYPRGAFP